MRLKALGSVFYFVFDHFLYELSIKIDKERGTVCSDWDADDLVKNVLPDLDRYVVDKELQNT